MALEKNRKSPDDYRRKKYIVPEEDPNYFDDHEDEYDFPEPPFEHDDNDGEDA